MLNGGNKLQEYLSDSLHESKTLDKRIATTYSALEQREMGKSDKKTSNILIKRASTSMKKENQLSRPQTRTFTKQLDDSNLETDKKLNKLSGSSTRAGKKPRRVQTRVTKIRTQKMFENNSSELHKNESDQSPKEEDVTEEQELSIHKKSKDSQQSPALGTESFNFFLNKIECHKESSESTSSLKEPNKKFAFVVRELLPGPNPLLPKSINTYKKPPDCPLKTIKFQQLRKFQTFKEDVMLSEELGSHFDIMAQKHLGRESKISEVNPVSQLAETIENNRLMQNIVFLRDSSILETVNKNITQLNQYDVFHHENYLDVNKLIADREMEEKYSMADQESPIAKIRLRLMADLNKKQLQGFQHQLQNAEDLTLLFESRFETGNLYLAQKVSDQEYNCLMQNDINSIGHTQWFYFRVQNTKAGHSVKFNMMNYSKGDSMFNYGMKVTLYSEKKAQNQGVGWHRGCSDISYFKNNIRKDNRFLKFYFTATFTYTFEYDEDVVFFSYCYPHTYTDLQNEIAAIEMDPLRRNFIVRQTLCKTLAGVDCPLLTITSSVKKQQPKKGVVITARQHPGETVGSFMMRGVINFLTDPEDSEAAILRDNFVFKIIPMLNPDGVINGNYRCSLAGCDLNRRWKYPNKTLHPEIYYTKKLAKALHQERQCVLFCDLHGHSRKPNIFVYGCTNIEKPAKTRILPFILSKISSLFQFKACRFGVQKEREATARVAVFKELKTCPQVFTLESTFSGMDYGQYQGQHITIPMLESMGKDLCRSLIVQQCLGVPVELKLLVQKGIKPKTFSAEQQDINPQAHQIYQNLMNELTNTPALIIEGEDSNSSGSDSEPSEDNLDPKSLIKKLPVVDKALSLALKRQMAQPLMARPIAMQPCLIKQMAQRAGERVQERAASPKKVEKPTTITQNQVVFTRKNRSQIPQAKLPEIKEDKHDIAQTPNKVKRSMIDAETQTYKTPIQTVDLTHITSEEIIQSSKHQARYAAAPVSGNNHNFVNLIRNVVVQNQKPAAHINLFNQSNTTSTSFTPVQMKDLAAFNKPARSRPAQINTDLKAANTIENLCQILYQRSIQVPQLEPQRINQYDILVSQPQTQKAMVMPKRRINNSLPNKQALPQNPKTQGGRNIPSQDQMINGAKFFQTQRTIVNMSPNIITPDKRPHENTYFFESGNTPNSTAFHPTSLYYMQPTAIHQQNSLRPTFKESFVQQIQNNLSKDVQNQSPRKSTVNQLLHYQSDTRNHQVMNPLTEARSSQQSISKLPHLQLKNYSSVNELDPTIQQKNNRAADYRQSGNQANIGYQTTVVQDSKDNTPQISRSGVKFGILDGKFATMAGSYFQQNK